jgi:hypothetical protein
MTVFNADFHTNEPSCSQILWFMKEHDTNG